MTRENLRVAKALFRAWNRGDRDGWLALAHPEVEWSSAILRQMEGAETVSRGRTELASFWDEWHALWSVDIEVSEMRDLGDTVLTLARFRTRGMASGVEVERSIGYVFELEDGLLRRARAYLSPEEALEAVGLRE
jgi:ketosteroid isomerase-like protein